MKLFERTCRRIEQVARKCYEGKSSEELCKGGKDILHKYEDLINQRLKELTKGREISAGWLVKTGDLSVGFGSPIGFCLFGESSDKISCSAIEKRNETIIEKVLEKNGLYSHIDPRRELVFYRAHESYEHGFRSQTIVGVNPKNKLFVFTDSVFDKYWSRAVKRSYNINDLLDDFVPKVSKVVNEANRIVNMPEMRGMEGELTSIQRDINELKYKRGLNLRIDAMNFAEEQLKYQ